MIRIRLKEGKENLERENSIKSIACSLVAGQRRKGSENLFREQNVEEKVVSIESETTSSFENCSRMVRE